MYIRVIKTIAAALTLNSLGRDQTDESEPQETMNGVNYLMNVLCVRSGF